MWNSRCGSAYSTGEASDEEVLDQVDDLGRVRLERPVARVQDVDLGLGQVAPVRLGGLHREEYLVAASHDQGRRQAVPEVLVDLRPYLLVRLVVGVELQLHLDVARALE